MDGQPVRIGPDLLVPMRDGVQLSADVCFPATGERFPAAPCRTISYNQQRR